MRRLFFIPSEAESADWITGPLNTIRAAYWQQIAGGGGGSLRAVCYVEHSVGCEEPKNYLQLLLGSHSM